MEPKVQHLGYDIDSTGLGTAPQTVQAVEYAPTPKKHPRVEIIFETLKLPWEIF